MPQFVRSGSRSADSFIGGAGADVFVFTKRDHGADTVIDFDHGDGEGVGTNKSAETGMRGGHTLTLHDQDGTVQPLDGDGHA
jgi:Ca2+-binding RTX toxin-like protein